MVLEWGGLGRNGGSPGARGLGALLELLNGENGEEAAQGEGGGGGARSRDAVVGGRLLDVEVVLEVGDQLLDVGRDDDPGQIPALPLHLRGGVVLARGKSGQGAPALIDEAADVVPERGVRQAVVGRQQHLAELAQGEDATVIEDRRVVVEQADDLVQVGVAVGSGGGGAEDDGVSLVIQGFGLEEVGFEFGHDNTSIFMRSWRKIDAFIARFACFARFWLKVAKD